MNVPDAKGYFDSFGGKFMPETLLVCLTGLEAAYRKVKKDKKFKHELDSYLREYVGRPSPLTFAANISDHLGMKIYLKREDLLHTGAHKINNTVGQALLARYMGKKRIIAETGAGQHGVATATVAALLGFECDVYMGAEDIVRQKMNVFRMKTLGAKVIPVENGTRTLKDACSAALRDWVGRVEDTYYLLGSVIGPHPYPEIVRDFQTIIGREARRQFRKKEKGLPDYLVACVGGGSNAMGLFYPFFRDRGVKFIGVEAGGTGFSSRDHHGASLGKGKVGVLHGTKTFILQDRFGQISDAHSIAPGLDYPGVGPEHAYYKKIKRAEYVSVGDRGALEGFEFLSRREGIIPALESAHAVQYVRQMAKVKKNRNKKVILCLSGRGDKDLEIVEQCLR